MKRVLTLFLAVLMILSVLPMGVFADGNVITAVDTSGLVMETAFPFTGNVTNASKTDVWTYSAYGTVTNVVNPVFYETIPATVDGKEVDLAVKWVSKNYQSTKPGTYTFTATASGYTWACEAPVITVKVVDGIYQGPAASFFGMVSPDGTAINVVFKPSTNGAQNQIYDATGCNQLYRTHNHLGVLRCDYVVEGDTITLNAQAGVKDIVVHFAKYQAEKLRSDNADTNVAKQTGARSWRVMRSDSTVEFDVVFDAGAFGGEAVTRHIVVNF